MTTLRSAFAALLLAAFAAPAPAAAQQRIIALSEQDEAAYRAAFQAIEAGNWRGVSSALSRTEDDVLEGAVRGQQLLSRGYGANWSEYTNWLSRYGDYGIAQIGRAHV